jgi:ribosomal protein S18 acetylase RimI-like enzyme
MDEKEILIRKACLPDLDKIQYLYSGHMFDSYLSGFGDSFVRGYLKVILKSENCFTLIAERPLAAGFITAVFDREKLLSEMFFSFEFLFSCAKQILIRPILVLKSLGLIPYLFNSTYANDIKSELLFIAIDPGYRRRGLGMDLINKALNLMKENGVKKIRVSAIAANQAVNPLLKKLGFQMEKSFKLFGKKMHLYNYEIY